LGLGIKVLIESKPNDDEIKKLKDRHGVPIIRRINRIDVSDLFLPLDEYKSCKGEGAVMIQDEGERFLLVRKKNEESWFLPSGRIRRDEGIEEGTIRETFEETGLQVKLERMPAIHIVNLYFTNTTLRLWHFIFISRNYIGTPGTLDKYEIGDVRFFKTPPTKNREFEKTWIRMVIEDIT